MLKNLTMMEKLALVNTALGEEKADRVLLGGSLVNVFTLEVYLCDIAIRNGYIACMGDVSHTIGPETVITDVSGCYLTPGLICNHMHVGGSHINMTEFGKLALLHGSTAITTDMFEVGIVTGVKGVRFMIDQLKKTGLRPLFCIPMPAYHQNEVFENAQTFTEQDAFAALQWEDCYGVNELNLTKLAKKDEGVMRIAAECERLGKTLVGHASELRGKELQAALCFAGMTGDHENVNWDDAHEEARLGMAVQVREGSVGADIQAVLGAHPDKLRLLGDFSFSTDEIDPARLNQLGHLDYKIKRAVRAGVPILDAIRAATLNAARSINLDRYIGSIAPSKCADILVLSDLDEFVVRDVFVGGELLVEKGQYIKEVHQPDYPAFLRNTVKLLPLCAKDFEIPAPRADGEIATRVIGIIADGNLFSQPLVKELSIENGLVQPNMEEDIIKVFQFDRHLGSGNVGKGFIHGMGLTCGALASTYNPCSENLNVVGTNDRDMAAAANYLITTGGGFVAVRDGKVLAALELPIAGILATDDYKTTGTKMEAVHAAAKILGCPLSCPFHQLAFMVFPAHFGTYKLCTYGLADADHGVLVDLFEEGNEK